MVLGQNRASTATMEIIMRELNIKEMEETSGGAAWWAPAAVVLVATHVVIPFAEGFIEELTT